ncbi:MAG: pantoate--beta-alanine ligase [Luteibacter sp.]|jgi:pantoate--beta-alanine ligase|uniref:pantoate--beta-alanine ligase n=1 Tax=Rhodanobacteraceae TaxID=1775411 RepID=UPI00056BCBCB|nr:MULTISPECIES: pantoate--beta-alanine ligase [Rhodanobacteraceae]MDQ7996769.1 pantoate--beta-alanine ligase [Luteibacter sp.]MDQ8050824.1 pantoate--beta-alanine ligase [Luteibacter sp.]MDR6643337.1 pantoate--beta-alanine ligase [Luteibacter sp. 1214]SDF24822.1 pantothenate synthetase [Dyella sp. 333MFSha]SKB51593.1 pantothenate synthetase [Luteibacter sp. 22Crub2.1]
MQTVTDAAALRATVRGWRAAGHNVGFVPTMGNLHAGHHSLLKLARARADRVVASVFVNPTQFGPGEDFERYPRTLAQDQAGLAEAGCDILFAPEVSTMYPFGPAASVSIHVPVITDTLEGAHRPGHFDGVATVVAKLFSLVQPDLAVFGQKDFQQLKVIERMVADLSLSVKVMSAPTLRDEDGLAKSSRNQYLSTQERARAPQIYATLTQMRDLFGQGHSWQALEQAARARLERAGFVPDYVAIRRADDLTEPTAEQRDGLVALVAARLGNTRLIDNLPFD